jgi:hypothetical protein
MVAAPKITTELIGPDEAAEMLAQHNLQNRTLAPKTVARYARAMKDGEWQFVGDPIRFDRTGELLDGQHRLAAVVDSGCAQQFVIVRNLEPEAQRYMDAGRKRTAADQLRIEGMKNAHAAAGIANHVMHWLAGDMVNHSTSYSTFEIVEFVESNLDDVEAAVHHARAIHRVSRSGPSVPGAAYFMAVQATDVQTAGEFFSSLAVGTGLESGSPILLLRNKLIDWATARTRLERAELAFFFTRCWNAWRKGEKLTKLQRPRGSEITNAALTMRG